MLAALEQREQQRRLELLRHRIDRLRDARPPAPTCRSRLIVTGLCSISRASATIGGGMVALKNSVCRFAGRWRRMRRMSGRKPMSSMRSASSSTRYSRPVELRVRLRGSDRAGGPGVATMTSTPLRKACSCGPMPTPPKTAAPVIGVCTARSFEVLEDLRRQLARRRQHQRARRAARPVDQLVQDRQQERGGLAAAGHGAGEHVAPLQRRRDGVGLDGRRPGEAELLEALEQIGMELEGAEWHRRILARRCAPRRGGTRGFAVG